MDNFTYETVERLEAFASFLVNFRGRTLDVRNPAKSISHKQIETWSLIESEFAGRLREEQQALESAADASRVIAGSRLYDTVQEHTKELERLINRLRAQISEAETLEQQLLGADRELESFEESTIDAASAHLRQAAEGVRRYLEAMSSGY